MQGQALCSRTQGRYLHFHARHVNTNRTFTLARLAGHAQLHSVRHLITDQSVWSHLTR